MGKDQNSEYKKKYEDYTIKIEVPDPDRFDPQNEAVEVRLTTRDGQEYYADFITRRFIDLQFEKNRRTGECASGTYFSMPNMIIVEEISNQNIMATIDDLIDMLDIEAYFKKVN